MVTPDIVLDGNSFHTDVDEAGESGVLAVDVMSADSVVPATNCRDLWGYKMSCWKEICHMDHYDGPPGGLLDPSSPIHPWDMSNFPFLINVCSRTQVLPPTSNTNYASPFCDTLSELQHDCLLPFLSCMHVCVDPPASSSLADGGTNVCVTYNPMLLVDVIKIDPIPLRMVVGNKMMSSFCMHKGFLPMPLLDSSIHYQPFLVCLDATDTILFPEHIIKNNYKFAR
jgi:hypothetical protein